MAAAFCQAGAVGRRNQSPRCRNAVLYFLRRGRISDMPPRALRGPFGKPVMLRPFRRRSGSRTYWGEIQNFAGGLGAADDAGGEGAAGAAGACSVWVRSGARTAPSSLTLQ
jgi:hypothetical protein